MELFATDNQKLAFLLETEAALLIFPDALVAEAAAIPQVDLPQEELPEDKRPNYVTDYIGSKQKLLAWIWKNTPESAESVIDAFCGSSAVAYMYKTRGLAVTTNDQLRYAYHTARAIVENKDVRLTQNDVTKLLTKGSNTGNKVRANFGGIFFAKGVHEIIDIIRSNADDMPGLKRDLALCALGKTCISCRAGFGHFTASTTPAHLDTPDEFRERFVRIVARLNALVFDNGKDCKALNGDVNEALSKTKADLAYFDPPYATQFSTTNYEKAYHFIEGLMTYWEGKEINQDSPIKSYKVDQQTISRTNASEFFKTFMGNAAHIKYWLISYRDKAFPTDAEMKTYVKDAGKSAKLQSHDHTYRLSSKVGDASHAQELLFVCSPADGNTSKADGGSDEGLSSVAEGASDAKAAAVWEERGEWLVCTYHPVEDFKEGSIKEKQLDGDAVGVTVATGTIEDRTDCLQSVSFDLTAGWGKDKAGVWLASYEQETDSEAGLNDTGENKAAASVTADGHLHTSFVADVTLNTEAGIEPGMPMLSDPTFNFILCHVGTNKNGDHFTREELASRFPTAINKKIDLQHAQGFTDIVGGIIGSEFREDEVGPRIECVGELYVNEAPNAPLAYKTMKRGIVTQVSMECDYEEGECSICGKRRKNANDACIHLRKYKGAEFQGKPVFEILHGVTFTGVGILDRKGADENARITQVASKQATNLDEGSSTTMDPKDKDGVAAEGGDVKTPTPDAEAAKPQKGVNPFAPKDDGGDGGDGGGTAPTKDDQIKTLTDENTALKKENDALKKELDAMKMEKQASENKSKASKLVKTLEKAGMAFGTDDDREAEINRLAGLSEDAYAAAEATYQRMATGMKAAAAATTDDKKDDGKVADADKGGAMKTDASDKSDKAKAEAGVRPRDVEDANPSLTADLTDGLMQAFGFEGK